MAFLGGYSEDFDLDDDGILRDSTESGGILIDDDGIVRDDFDVLSKHGSSTHWTDSGLGGDKPSSTPSTLRQLDLQSYTSFEDVSRNFDESNVNISDLEASKDDLSFDADFNDTADRGRLTPKGNRSGLSSRSSFDHSLNYDETFDNDDKKGDSQKDLFGEEYYRQLQELGVLVDEDDFAHPRDSLQEFENLETHYSRDYDNDENARDEIEEFLRNTDTVTGTRDSMDIEHPDQSLRKSDDKLLESHGFDSFDHRSFEVNEEKRTRPNTASSTRTISSRSFPEISPEEALELYTERLQTLDHDEGDLSIPFVSSQSLRTDPEDGEHNDDEIFFVPSQEHDGDSPKPAKMPAYDNENKPSITPQRKAKKKAGHSSDDSRSDTPQGQDQSYEENSDRSRSVTPQADVLNNPDNTGYHSNDGYDSLTQVTRLDSRNKTYSETDTFRPDSALSELSSAASEGRSSRPKASKAKGQGQGKPPMQQKGNLAHARSQESFFDHETGMMKKIEKGPKRLLPKPSAAEENQALKIRSKSATNLNNMGPVKPTHMTLSEIRNINIDDPELDLIEFEKSENKSGASDVPKGELTKKLKQESSKRQQATQLVRQLQSDYDKLLSKYALAELTIDQMRLGAKISIHANSPTPSQATSGSLQSAQHLHMLQLAGAQRGSIASASPQIVTPNVFFPESQPQDGGSESRFMQQRGTSPAQLPRSDSTNSMDSMSTPRGDVEQPGGIANDAEKVKIGLLFQARNLDERMQSFQTLLGENHLSLEEQEGVFDKIRNDHEKLRRDYLQSKEDYNVLRRSTPAGLDVAFDQEKELEGELFKLGMKFDEIHEKVEENLKEKSAKRQPFQQKNQEMGTSDNEMDVDPSTENVKKKIQGVTAGNDLLERKRDSEFDKKLKHLHEEYNALMDRYRRLKQMAKTPEREQEIDNLVKKLRKICKEEPDIFKLPTDLQPGTAQSLNANVPQTQESKSSDKLEESNTKPPSPEKRKLPQPKPDKTPPKSYEIMSSESWSLAESIDRWARSKESAEGDGRQMSRSQDHLNDSMASNRSYRSEDRDGQGHNDSRLSPKQRSNSYSSLSSRGRHTPDFSSHDRDSPVPSVPRPRRHDFPERERKDRKELKKSLESLRASSTSLATDSGIDMVQTPKFRPKRAEGGSTTSLQDSGISEHEGGATGGHSGPNSPLSKLPGPGKFKQMTGRREADTDSGFIGSMVGSEVSAGNLSSRRQPPQSPLRLRHPGDVPQRPSSRQSSRSEDSARATTPRSVASSKSSRRTPTKAFPINDSQQTENEARVKTPTNEERKAPSRSDSRTKTRDQQTSVRSRDYTDDSYTSVTESEMSFDSDMRPRHSKPSSRNTSQRNIDKIVEDSEEEFSVDPTLNETTDINMSWITSDSEHPSVRQSQRQKDGRQSQTRKQETAKPESKVSGSVSRDQGKGQGQGQVKSRDQGKGPVQRRGDMTDESTTSTMTFPRETTRDETQDTTQDTYTSDETTPRSVIERERKQAKLKQQSRPNQETIVKRGSSPVTETAPPPRVTTPLRAARSEVHPKKLLDSSVDSGTERLTQISQRPEKPQYVDRSIGSGSEDTIIASDADTAATRGSVNSARLKLLTDEIGKLREEFIRANQEKSQQHQPQHAPPPAPPQPPHDQYYDQYFDPTEDPLAFMRGPRRRANSFSGHGGRDWDYDWTLPNVNRDGDIPLGYAAADAFATPRHKHRQEDVKQEEPRTRGRHRLQSRIHQRNRGTQHQGQQNGYDSDQSPTRVPAEEVQSSPPKVAGHYGYYSPQQTTASPQSTQAKPPVNMQAGKRVYGSQPNLSYTGYQPPPRDQMSASGSTRSTGPSITTRPLRQTLYSYAANPSQARTGYNQTDFQPPPYGYQNRRQFANDDIRISDGQTRFIPNGASDIQSVQSEGGIYTSTCPICGSSGYHTHGDFVYPPTDHNTPIGYLVHDGRQVVETVHIPVFALQSNEPAPKPSRPLSTQSFRSPLPFRIYKAPPPLKPHLFPITIPKKLTPTSHVTFQAPPTPRNQPMAVNHEAVHEPIIEMDYPTEEGAGPRSRARSRSWGRAGRIRHYSPDGRVRSRYFVREFGNVESDSAESEDEELPKRRSRSVGRRRLRHGRKYRRVRGEEEYESDRGFGASLSLSAAGEDDLNRSLRLVEEIDELTNKMMGTVSGELAKARMRKEFGSTIW